MRAMFFPSNSYWAEMIIFIFCLCSRNKYFYNKSLQELSTHSFLIEIEDLIHAIFYIFFLPSALSVHWMYRCMSCRIICRLSANTVHSIGQLLSHVPYWSIRNARLPIFIYWRKEDQVKIHLNVTIYGWW
jgi:hypothetical protein